jgi:hypothetical protein
VWDHLLPALKDGPLPTNQTAQSKLRHTLGGLKLAEPSGQAAPTLSKLAGKGVFDLTPNTLGFKTGTLTFSTNSYVLEFGGANATAHAIGTPNGWLRHETSLAAPRIIGGGAPKQGTKHKVAGHAEWKDEKTLELILRYYETPHHETITCKFDGDKISISFLSSINKIRNAKDPRPVLEGTLVA